MNHNLSKTELLKEIEAARNKMHQLSYNNNRTSAEIVEMSTHLDKLLNIYQKLTFYMEKNCEHTS